MFEFLRGKLCYIDPQYVVIDINGVGYQVFCPNPFVYEVNLEHDITIYTYQHVREDMIRIFGFRSRTERELFTKLLNVSGIGPKGGLAILASGIPEQVVAAIENEDEHFLMKFPGVGKKTSRQIILDLKGKLASVTEQQNTTVSMQKNAVTNLPKQLEDAIEALKALGYAEREIKKVAAKLASEQLSTEQYIKKGLQLLLKL